MRPISRDMSSSPGSPGSGSRGREPRSPLAEATALLAHDLNNQLALLLANHEFLEEMFGGRDDVDPDVRETLTTSQAALQHMMTLVRNMSDISKMEDPGLRPMAASTDLARLVRAVVREHRPLYDRGAVELSVVCPDVLRADVDALLVKRIAHNLMSNARRFVQRDGAVRVTAALETVPEGEDLVLTFSNNGPPIATERRTGLFDKYRMNPDGRLARGMGLYFCRLACEAHGGSIALSRDGDFPTVFIARLACGARAAGDR